MPRVIGAAGPPGDGGFDIGVVKVDAGLFQIRLGRQDGGPGNPVGVGPFIVEALGNCLGLDHLGGPFQLGPGESGIGPGRDQIGLDLPRCRVEVRGPRRTR